MLELFLKRRNKTSYATRFAHRSGVQLIFQDYEHMKDNKPSRETLEQFMGDFNSMQVQCPVNLQTIRYSNSQLSGSNDYWSVPGMEKDKDEDLRTPSFTSEGKEENEEDYDDGEEAAGVFPACGHLVTYSTEMAEGLIDCPLCRKPSTLVPLSIAYTPAVTHGDKPPSHIFNPCGCAASQDCVKFWSTVKVS